MQRIYLLYINLSFRMISYYLYKIIRRLVAYPKALADKAISVVLLKGNNVKYSDFRCSGYPYIMVSLGGTFSIGKGFSMNNGIGGSPGGGFDRCVFFVDKEATMTIGDDVGISQASLICHQSITIGNRVKIGGTVRIYDTDFHSLDPKVRASSVDLEHKVKAAVVVKDNAFIGAYSIILKGVTIGENSVIGAGSIVAKSVPDNQVWAGNPAKFIRNI